MPVKNIRGVDLVYEIVGDQGPLVTLTPGGRRGGGSQRELASLIAGAGFRVLLHDRRNMGASGIAFQGHSEHLPPGAVTATSAYGRRHNRNSLAL